MQVNMIYNNISDYRLCNYCSFNGSRKKTSDKAAETRESNSENIYKNMYQKAKADRYDVFLSHATADKSELQKARKFFEDKGKSVFVAEDYYNEDGKSVDNIDSLRKAMDVSDAFYYLLSQNEAKSGFMPWKIGYFDGKYGKMKKIQIFSMDDDVNINEALGKHEFLKLYLKDEPLVISGFPGVGREYLKNCSDLKVLNLDSPDFSWKKNKDGSFELDENGRRIRNLEFPDNYMKSIKEAVKQNYDIILVSAHESVRNSLNDAKIPHVLVYPKLDMKSEMMDRCSNNAAKDSIDVISNNWDSYIDSMQTDTCPNKFELTSGEYLKDISDYIKQLKECGRIL